METNAASENVYSEAYRKKRDKSDLFHFCAFITLFVFWSVLLYFSKAMTIDLIITDSVKFVVILSCYFGAKFFLFLELSKKDKASSYFKKLSILLLITASAFSISYFLTKTFSDCVEWFTIMVFPAFLGAFKSFSKDRMSSISERKENRKYVMDLEREAAKMPD